MTHRRLTPNPVTTVGSMALIVLGAMVLNMQPHSMTPLILGVVCMALGMVGFTLEITKL